MEKRVHLWSSYVYSLSKHVIKIGWKSGVQSGLIILKLSKAGKTSRIAEVGKLINGLFHLHSRSDKVNIANCEFIIFKFIFSVLFQIMTFGMPPFLPGMAMPFP